MVKISVRSGNEIQKISVEAGTSLLAALRRRPELSPPAPCAGRGHCGRCRVILDDAGVGGVPDFHADEMALLDAENRNSGVRLACRLPVRNGMAVSLENAEHAVIETRAEGEPVDLDPVLIKKVARLSAGTLQDQRSTATRVEEELGVPPGSFPANLARQLPGVPEDRLLVTVVLDDGRPVALDAGRDSSDTLWAAAVDIGTTTVAMYLVNLVDGAVAGSKAEMNRQAPFGADVVSRLEYARRDEAAANHLQLTVVEQLSDLLNALVREHEVSPEDVHMMTVAGNTAMMHFMTGWDPTGLGEAPFLPTALESPAFSGKEIGLTDFPRLRIWPLPSLSAYVGGDITGGLVASAMGDRNRTDLLLDIGTNGEMALGGSAGLVCCSTAAGPAFEGVHLSSGMGSISGAVDHVDVENGAMNFSTIGRAEAQGFCGSGVVDLVAYFARTGLMDDTGRFVETVEDVPSSLPVHHYSFTVEREETGPLFGWSKGDRRLTFSQKDLREVQLAKAAIAAGIQTLLGQARLTVDDIDTLWLAGGFGSYIRPESAGAIGLIPPALVDKTRSLGNAAARGALLCLLSRAKRDEAIQVARETQTIELSGRPDFQNAYIEAMMFSGNERETS